MGQSFFLYMIADNQTLDISKIGNAHLVKERFNAKSVAPIRRSTTDAQSCHCFLLLTFLIYFIYQKLKFKFKKLRN
jgi:hypothetical protein